MSSKLCLKQSEVQNCWYHTRKPLKKFQTKLNTTQLWVLSYFVYPNPSKQSVLALFCAIMFTLPSCPPTQTISWLQTNLQETSKTASDKRIMKTKLLIFWLSVLLYPTISDNANICTYAHWSSTAGYIFLLKATTTILLSYLKKTPQHFKGKVQMSWFIKYIFYLRHYFKLHLMSTFI